MLDFLIYIDEIEKMEKPQDTVETIKIESVLWSIPSPKGF